MLIIQSHAEQHKHLWLFFLPLPPIRRSFALPWLKSSRKLVAGRRVRQHPRVWCRHVLGWVCHVLHRCQASLCSIWCFLFQGDRWEHHSCGADWCGPSFVTLPAARGNKVSVAWQCHCDQLYIWVWGANETRSVCSLQDNRVQNPDVKTVMELFSRMEKLKKIEWVKKT